MAGSEAGARPGAADTARAVGPDEATRGGRLHAAKAAGAARDGRPGATSAVGGERPGAAGAASAARSRRSGAAGAASMTCSGLSSTAGTTGGSRATRCATLDAELRRLDGFARAFPPHVHDAYVIGLVRAGRRMLDCGGRRIAMGPGDLLALNPGDAHGCEPVGAEPLAYDSITLGRGLVEAVAGRRGARLRGPVVRDAAAARLMDGAVRALGIHDENAAEEACCLLVGLLLEDAGAAAPAEGDALDEAAAYLHRHQSRAVRLADLAAVAGLSRCQLVRAWRRRFGLTPMQSLASLRVERARALLAAGASPAEAAQVAGFSDQAHLTRSFRDRLGLTPGAYRRAVRDEGDGQPNTADTTGGGQLDATGAAHDGRSGATGATGGGRPGAAAGAQGAPR